MLTQVLADGLDKSNGAMLLIPLIASALVIPIVFAWTKRSQHKPDR